MTHETAPTADAPATAREVLRTLRPQVYGNGSPDRIRDPLVEPLWRGVRVLAAVDEAGATIVDADGDPATQMVSIVDGLIVAADRGAVVLDGFITKQPTRPAAGSLWPDEMPSMGRLLGLRRDRGKDTIKLKEEALDAHTFEPDDEIAFVAIDLLWLDGTPLLDIPLLERRRLLDGALTESAVIRLGAYVRPPVATWLGSWRSQGFGGVTYKAANSRYLPGQPNPEWVVAGMPSR